MLLDDSRSALVDVLHNELAKLRQLSACPELLGEGERKCLETYARIVKLLERAVKPEEHEEAKSCGKPHERDRRAAASAAATVTSRNIPASM